MQEPKINIIEKLHEKQPLLAGGCFFRPGLAPTKMTDKQCRSFSLVELPGIAPGSAR